MKRIIAIGTLVIMSSTHTYAEGSSTTICESLSSAAKTVMTSRQDNTDMAALMKIAGDNKIMSDMVIKAYEQPAFSSEPYQKKAIKQFSNNYYLSCIKAIKR